MGMYRSTYVAYGFRIPDTGSPCEMADRLDAQLTDPCFPDVGHIQAGDYDQDMTFLVTECTEVELGEFKATICRTTAEQCAIWNDQLVKAAEAIGLDEIPDPGWLVIPDLS
ncbi:hypothetical protein [Streptomyces sp. NPDC053048]|uniref:hypothetical protein n=1 Tax=Streptomyces sp. NPDC053048 TaxID=3365694 RepID=UPI0037D95267